MGFLNFSHNVTPLSDPWASVAPGVFYCHDKPESSSWAWL